MDEINLDGKKYISSKRASKITGYTNDYIGQLVRAGEIDGQKVGKVWFIEVESLLGHQYKQYNKKHKNTKKSLSEKCNSKLTTVCNSKTIIAIGMLIFVAVAAVAAGVIYTGNINTKKLFVVKPLHNATQSLVRFKKETHQYVFQYASAFEKTTTELKHTTGTAKKNVLKSVSTFGDFIKTIGKNISTITNTTLTSISSIPANMANVRIGASHIAGTTGDKIKDTLASAGDTVKKTSTSIKNSAISAGGIIGTTISNTKTAIKNTAIGAKNFILSIFSKRKKEKTVPTLATEEKQIPHKQKTQPKSENLIAQPKLITINKPIEKVTVEKTIERIISGITAEDMETRIQQLSNKLTGEIARVADIASNRSKSNFRAIALTNKIDNLSNVTVSGVSGLTDSDIPDGITASTSFRRDSHRYTYRHRRSI
jgi:hypothetical protein